MGDSKTFGIPEAKGLRLPCNDMNFGDNLLLNNCLKQIPGIFELKI